MLISLAEQFGFEWSYLIASGGTIAMISIFSASIFKNVKIGLIMAGSLILLYTFLYIILQLQDYALLMGSVGLFIILAVLMYFSRGITWGNRLNE